jgi:N-acetylmuramidase
MMGTKSLPHRKERRILTVAEQHLRPFHSTCRLGSRARNRCQTSNLLIGHRQLDRLPPPCHDATPRSLNHKQGIHEQITGSIAASFMESVV